MTRRNAWGIASARSAMTIHVEGCPDVWWVKEWWLESNRVAGRLPLPLRLRVLVVDDHDLVREGLRRILESASPPFEVVEAGDAAQALAVLASAPVDVATVDLSMPGMGGLLLAQRIKARHPHVGVLVLSMHSEAQYAMRAFRNGADGYLTKTSAGAELVVAIRQIAAGGVYITPTQAESAVRGMGPGSRTTAELSDRELEVLRRLVAGERPKEIARGLNLSIKTISTHKARILDKLGLPSTAALVRYSIEHGLVPEQMPVSGVPTP